MKLIDAVSQYGDLGPAMEAEIPVKITTESRYGETKTVRGVRRTLTIQVGAIAKHVIKAAFKTDEEVLKYLLERAKDAVGEKVNG